MKRPMQYVLTLAVLAVPSLAFAQEPAPEDIDLVESGLQAIGMMLNAGGVWFAVRALLKYYPALRESKPQLIPLIALVAGPALNWLGAALSSVLLTTIDFAPIVAILTQTDTFSLGVGLLGGTGAVVGDQVNTQRKRAIARRR